MVETGSALDTASLYWDVRLPEQLNTVGVRVSDACSRVDEAVMLADLSRALVRLCRERGNRGESCPSVRPELLRAAHRCTSRHRLEDELVDADALRAVPAQTVIEKMLAIACPALEEAGDLKEVAALVRETLERGNGASRQRRAYERAGRLEEVVDAVIEETAPSG